MLKKYGNNRIRLVAMVVLVAFFLSFLVMVDAAWGATGTITGSVVNIRSGPGTSYTKVGAITKGAQVEVVKQTGEWCQIRYGGNKTGWVAASYISVKSGSGQTPSGSNTGSKTTGVTASRAEVVAVQVTGAFVNLRQGPGTSYPVVAKVNKGAILTVVGTSGEWYRVTGPGVPSSYIASWLVQPLGSAGTPSAGAKTGDSPTAPQTAQLQKAVVTGQTANLRSGPGTTYSKVGQVSKGDTLSLVKSSGDWHLVRTAGGTEGWVAGWLVAVQNPKPDSGSSSASGSSASESQGVSPSSPGSSGPSGSSGTEVPVPSRGSERYEPQPEPEPPVPEALPVVEGELTGISEIVADNMQVVTVGMSSATAYETKSESGHFVLTLKGIRKSSVGDVVGLNGRGASQVQVEEKTGEYPVTVLTFAIIGNPVIGVTPSQGGKELKVFIKADLSARRTGQARVVLDPGHGGKDPGAIGPAGIQEKDINLPITMEVGRILSLDGVDVVYTRTADVYLSLAERSQIANSADADVFVSIHCNGSTNPDKQGISTYYYAPVENEVLYSQEGSRRMLASCIQKALLGELGRTDMGVRQGNFAVLRDTVIPCALVETLFITNPEEEMLLAQTTIQMRAAAAIARGIKDYLASIGRM